MIIKKNIFPLFLIIIMSNCSSIEITKRQGSEITETMFKQHLNAEVLNTDCWINLMPNSGERFFISGQIKVKTSTEYDLKSLELSKVYIYQGNKLIYEILPLVQEKESTEMDRTFIYSTIKGLRVNSGLSIDKEIDASIIFNFGSDELEYKISGIKIEKVY